MSEAMVEQSAEVEVELPRGSNGGSCGGASVEAYFHRDPTCQVRQVGGRVHLTVDLFNLALPVEGWAEVIPALIAVMPERQRSRIVEALTQVTV